MSCLFLLFIPVYASDYNNFRNLFVLHLAYDGNFHLVCKDKEFDKWDICLSDGRKYFVDVKGFKEHLTVNDDMASNQSNKVCSIFGTMCTMLNIFEGCKLQ